MKKLVQAFALACCAVVAGLAVATFDAPSAHAATYEASQITWKVSAQKVYAYAGKHKLTGMQTIGNKTYLFTKTGVQRTGWRKAKGEYRFFRVANEAGGYMVKGKVINGVRLDSEGAAVQTSNSLAELNVLMKANKLLDTLVKPTWTKQQKLRACWNYMTNRHKVRECSYRKFSNVSGWQRAFALDIFDRHGGSCYSMGSALAYLGNAIGFKKCQAVSSGGHGWARINGLVYDAEWTTWHAGDWYGIHGSYGGVNYTVNSTYVVTISPNAKALGSASSSSTKTGLVKKGSSLYYYKNGKKVRKKWVTVKGRTYRFGANGKALTGCKKVGKSYWLFKANGVLAKGKGVHFVTVKKTKYRVGASGRCKCGWVTAANGTKRHYSRKGLLMKGIWVWGGKLLAFDATSGAYNASATQALRAAAVVDGDVTTLKALLGTPKKTFKVDVCKPAPSGLDAVGYAYVYEHLTLYTVLDSAGAETLDNYEAN